MSDKVCKKDNSQKPEKIWLPLKRTTKKSELKPLKDKEKNKDYYHYVYVLQKHAENPSPLASQKRMSNPQIKPYLS